jgi:hypothetical protein
MPWVIADVMDHLEGKYASLSMQKYSSNVIETCLKNSGEEGCVRIVRELINSSLFGQLLQDPFANYVVQCALKESKVGNLFLSYFPYLVWKLEKERSENVVSIYYYVAYWLYFSY